MKAKQYATKSPNEKWKWKHKMIQNLWNEAKAIERGKRVMTQFTSGNNKISNEQPNITAKATKERWTNKTQNNRRKKNHKDQSKNKLKKEIKKTIANIKGTKYWFYEKINKIDNL